ncbi:hypothetical protein VNO77_17156 [Canavalia gladiata]|uniref:Uncharacterized protein n=1 Tax=Canavalia gladiata TaxID=3824 RepID=A0AAN9LID6_CANGL
MVFVRCSHYFQPLYIFPFFHFGLQWLRILLLYLCLNCIRRIILLPIPILIMGLPPFPVEGPFPNGMEYNLKKE